MSIDRVLVFARRAASALPLLVLWVIGARAALAQEEVLIAISEEWRYQKGLEPVAEDWFEPDFDDSEWASGPTGIGYGDNDDATILDDMLNTYLVVFTRKAFVVNDPSTLEDATLRLTYDDGIVAYLNGTEIGRLNMPEGAVNETTSAITAGEPTTTGIQIPADLFIRGENVLAVSVHNSSLTSSDLSFLPELVNHADLCPKLVTCSFTFGVGVTLTWGSQTSYDSIAILRNGEEIEPSLDGTLQTFLDPDPPGGDVSYEVVATLEGSRCAALECVATVVDASEVIVGPGDDWAFFRGDQSPPADWNELAFDDSDWEFGPTGIGYGDGDDATILDDMILIADDPLTPDDESSPGYLAVFTRKSFNLSSLDGIESLTFSVVYDDGFVAYLNGEEFARRNMSAGLDDEFTAASVAIEPTSETMSIPIALARQGENVLAVSVHNAAVTSSDLSFVPIIATQRGGPATSLFRRGDADGNGSVNLTDGIFILRSLFQGGANPLCPDAADADDNSLVNLTDAIYILRSLFQGGADIPAPGPSSCGPDPTPDALVTCETTTC